ncbi:MAG: ArsR family transcriptional regulator [Chloroflexi bacterium]|nr:ArsR family transcriptional regulator [Chloroflexota bacterium]OQY79556.1 MAG: hypothetical protein B6D42_14875 [Anaerolineae bacterium UTCFX5]RIK19611.1 MAG: hypothetical protein DCC53_12920 [Chloroflexota bacterium]
MWPWRGVARPCLTRCAAYFARRRRSSPAARKPQHGGTWYPSTRHYLNHAAKERLMPSQALALIVHPVRLRILQALVRRERTTHQIADALPDVPVSSLYRHLRLLLEGGYIEIASTRSVNGIEEKTYQLSDSKPALLADQDFEGLDKAGLQQVFSLLTGMILTSFHAYLDATPDPDWKRDRLSCAEFTFFATPDEYDALWTQVWDLLQSAEARPAAAGRVPRKIAIAGYPGVSDPSDSN